MTKYERVLARDIEPGDLVARARTHAFYEVECVAFHPQTMTIHYVDRFGSDRPRKDARWWREVVR